MTAPIWLASPPEVHSALLSSGPGPGPLLTSAGEWDSLSVAYAEAAEELTALVADVEAGAWDGPSAASYAAAHVPYLEWLLQASADSAALAAEQQTTAAAYTTALATMPTLAELAGNHATHAVLTATNFFGINTIPIALTEADYVRMWIQAATVMGTYQAVSAGAVAAAPASTPAPEIVKADGPSAAAQASTTALESVTESVTDGLHDFLQWLWQLYTEFYNTVIQPFNNWLSSLPFLQAMFAGFDPYLISLGNPLTYLSPLNIAFAIGYPMDIGTYVALLSQMFTFVAADLTAAFASGNPLTIGFTIMFVTVEVIGTVVTDTIALLKTTLESTAAILMAVVPLLTVPLVPLAAGAVLAPIGVKGLVALAAAPPPPPPTPATPPVAALAPTSPPPSPTPTGAEASTPASTPAPSPPHTAAPPTTTGAGASAHMDAMGYLLGDLSSAAKRAAAAGAKKKAPEPDSAEEPAAAQEVQEQPSRSKRRRRATVPELGRGYEYADLESRPVAQVTVSEKRAAAQGFAGIVEKGEARPAAGLTRLAGDGFQASPRVPMMPGTWETTDSTDRRVRSFDDESLPEWRHTAKEFVR